MNTPVTNENESAVLGQKYAFATAALLLGIASYISLLGMEKAILAMVFAWLALKAAPAPMLTSRRNWGRAGAVLGAVHVALVFAIVIFGWRTILTTLQFAQETAAVMTRGPKVVLEVKSPDQEFTAYVEELPSVDPPNQSLVVERKDRRHFMYIAGLAEDVDSIEKVVWSPDSRVVVFHSRDYLTATRVTDWQTIRVFLGKEWTRFQPNRRSTFTSGGQGRVVDAIEFPGPDSFAYRIKGETKLHPLSFSSPALISP
jgi:hypothetical protein